jgi:dipeptidyl aminopeptidase/acylaminoacyl peptidase
MRSRIVARAQPVLILITLATPGVTRPIPEDSSDPPRTPLSIEDLYRLEAPQSLRLAPAGRQAAYIRQWVDPATRQERFALWMASGGSSEPRPIEPGQPDARSPIFSPDGRWIAFVSTRPRPEGWEPTPPAPHESDPATDVWLIATDGGQAIPLAGREKPYGRVFNDGFYGRLAFATDGRRLAFIADDGRDPRTDEERDADTLVVRDDGGEGYTGYRPAQVWVAELAEHPGEYAARRIERLTDDDAWYGDPQWAPDGKSLVVHANRTGDRESVRYSINKDYDLWAIDVATRTLRRLTTGPGPEVSPRFSPDGRRLACLSIPRKGSHMDTFNLAVVTLGEGGAATRVLFDHHGPGAEKRPHPTPSFPLPDDCWDGDEALIYSAPVGTETTSVRVDLRTGEGTRLDPLLDSEDGEAGVTTAVGRLLRRRRLTPPANPGLSDRLLAEVRVVCWEVEGRTVEGLLTVPPEPAARPPYALVVYPHGGPHSRSVRGFDFTAQALAAQGYAVFQPNFRGSAGYGQAFIDADRGDLGGGDMRDILAGVDELIRRGLVDRDRQFVYGVSYGGYMTCWLVGHTDRFRAAVAQNAVTDLDVMWGLSDLASWTEWEFGGRPWEVPRSMRDHSPLTYAASIRTPTLILHSRDDRRCPLPMGLMFHKALRANGVETRMVIYPGEGHGIRRPRHREDVLRRTLAWFRAHDKEQPPASTHREP